MNSVRFNFTNCCFYLGIEHSMLWNKGMILMSDIILQGNMSEIICYFVNNILQMLKILVYLMQHIVMKCDPKDRTWKL